MEKSVEEYLRRRVKMMGGVAYKFVSPGNNGVPDRLILLPGAKVAFAETKDHGKRPRLQQQIIHRRFAELGIKVYVPDSKTAVDEMLREVAGG